jgi:hypothetical protein
MAFRIGATPSPTNQINPISQPAALSASGPELMFERIAADGERYLPHGFRHGLYRVADPALGRVKHHSANQIAIQADEIEGYLRRGFLLWMRGEVSGQVNLIVASEIIRKPSVD